MMATLIEKEPNKLIKKKLPKYELGNLKKEERTEHSSVINCRSWKMAENQ